MSIQKTLKGIPLEAMTIDGIKSLIKSNEELLKVWSISKNDRCQLTEDNRYLNQLLKEREWLEQTKKGR